MRIIPIISSLLHLVNRDHDLLTGLTDDDHTQYLNTTRHDLKARHAAAVIGNLPASKITSERFGVARLKWTANKLLVGAGDTANPTVMDVPSVAQVLRKSADESVNGSDVLQDDDHLVLAMLANEIWLVEMLLKWVETANGMRSDGDYAFVLPSGASGWGIEYISDGVTEISDITVETEISIGLNSEVIARLFVLITCGATPGDAQFQWAQHSAQAHDVTLKENSCLIARLIS